MHEQLWENATPVEPETTRIVATSDQPFLHRLPEYLFSAPLEDGRWGLFVTVPPQRKRLHVVFESFNDPIPVNTFYLGDGQVPLNRMFECCHSLQACQDFLEDYEVEFCSLIEPELSYRDHGGLEALLLQRVARFLMEVSPCDDLC